MFHESFPFPQCVVAWTFITLVVMVMLRCVTSCSAWLGQIFSLFIKKNMVKYSYQWPWLEKPRRKDTEDNKRMNGREKNLRQDKMRNTTKRTREEKYKWKERKKKYQGARIWRKYWKSKKNEKEKKETHKSKTERGSEEEESWPSVALVIAIAAGPSEPWEPARWHKVT